MTNPERDPREVALAAGDTACGIEVLDRARGPARWAAGDDRTPYAAAARPVADRRVVLRRPLRTRPGRRHRWDDGRAAPAHRAADGELALHRRDRAPGLGGPPRDGPPRRGQPDDRRSRHQPLGGLDARHDRAARRPAVGGPAGRGTGRGAGVRAPRARAGLRRRVGGPGLPRVAAGRHVTGRDPHPAARCRALVAAGTTLVLDVDEAYEHGLLLDRGAATVDGAGGQAG